MPIKLLDEVVISRIAAGEVVERPASVVKELIENSLDAGSHQITVEVRDNGLGLIRVIDDGTGIPSPEVELAFDRYATSKIDSLQDLDSILTLGFRGEALPSIASVAQVEVSSCPAGEDAGTHIILTNGAVTRRETQGRSRGTTVTVRNLFRKVPARLKFLRSPATENSHIASIVSMYALAFPEVRFTLTIDNRVTLRTEGSGQLIDSVTQIYGLDVARNMLAVGDREYESSVQLKESVLTAPLVHGLTSTPTVSRSSRGYLHFFINRRWVQNRLLARAVEAGYRGLAMEGRHPIAIINIAVVPGDIDVNIHPSKAEVKFKNERGIFSAVEKAVRQALLELMPTPGISDITATYRADTPAVYSARLLEPSSASINHIDGQQAATETSPSGLPLLRVLGQLLNSYIVAEGPDGIYIIDQHAAHERILFEKIKEQRSRKEIEVQGLMEPVTIEVEPGQGELVKAHRQTLAEYGFSVEPFGTRTCLVRTVPLLLNSKDWMGLLRQLLDFLGTGDEMRRTEEVAASMACHAAIKAGQELTVAEMRELVRQLERKDIPHTCPHGRPVMIYIGTAKLAREFGRS